MFIGAAFVFSATMANPSRRRRCRGMTRSGCAKSSGMRWASARRRRCAVVDYHTLARWSFVVYWATIFCLVAVLIPHIGSTQAGARGAGLTCGFFQFQPSEFAKLAFILAAANFLSRPPDELRQPRDFLERHRADAAAVRVDFEGTGSGFGARVVADGLGDDVCRGHAEKISAEADRRRRGFAGRAVSGGYLVCADALCRFRCRIISATGCWFISAGLQILRPANATPDGMAEAPAACSWMIVYKSVRR